MDAGSTLYVLGVVRGERGADVVRLAGQQPRLLLARLALADGRPVTADELAELLWPEGRARHWEGALRGVVAKIRALLTMLSPDVLLA